VEGIFEKLTQAGSLHNACHEMRYANLAAA